MPSLVSRKILAGALLGGFLLPSVFLGAETAHAISFQSAQQGIISAGVGCASSYLLQRKLSSTLSSEISLDGKLTSVEVADAVNRKNTEAIAFKENCTKKIARAASQVVLREMTKETVAWINGGFNGQPLFVRNPGSFFKSLANQEINSLATTFSDRTKYPYGTAFIRGYVRTVQNTLERNAQYTLTQSLGGYTPAQYYNNFNYGGWKAWEASVLPQNNPIGFSLMVSAELDQRLAGTQQSKAQDIRDELQQGLGFLSPKICVDPLGYTPPANTFANINDLESSGVTEEEVTSAGGEIDMCRRYETSTPGGVVSAQLTSALDIPKENLLLAPEDLDASLQAVFDALLSQLFNKGLASLSNASSGGSASGSGAQVYSSGGYGNNSSAVTNTNTNTNTNDQWFDQNPQFDITDPTDLSAVITVQNAYIRAVIDDPAVTEPVLNPLGLYPPASSIYNNQTTLIRGNIKGQNYWLDRIIPEIFQLDYCIPGPHPGWEAEAQQKFFPMVGKVPNISGLNYLQISAVAKNNDFFTGLSNFISSIPGTSIASDIKDSFKKALTGLSWSEEASRKFHAAYIREITGIEAETVEDGSTQTREQFDTIMNALFERFVAAVNAQFSPVVLPSVAAESANLFGKIAGYQSIIAKNNQDIPTLQAAVRRLGELRQQVIDLNASRAAGSITQAEYDNSIGFVKRSFSSLSSSFVTTTDVSTIEDQTREIITDIVYIHNTLIKGPNGCEAQMPLVPARSRYRAWPYQQPHFYDYAQEGAVVHLDTLNIDSIYNNLVNGIVRPPYSSYHPFMQEAYFGTPEGASLGDYPGWAEIPITDLMNFDIGEVSATVWWFESKLGPLW